MIQVAEEPSSEFNYIIELSPVLRSPLKILFMFSNKKMADIPYCGTCSLIYNEVLKYFIFLTGKKCKVK